MEKRFKPLTRAVVFALVMATTVTMGLSGAILYVALKSQYFNELQEQSDASLQKLALSLEYPLWNIDTMQVARVVEGAMLNRDIACISVKVSSGAGYRDITWGRGYLWTVQSGVECTEGGSIKLLSKRIIFKDNHIGDVDVYVTSMFLESNLKVLALMIAAFIICIDVILVFSIYYKINIDVVRPAIELNSLNQ